VTTSKWVSFFEINLLDAFEKIRLAILVFSTLLDIVTLDTDVLSLIYPVYNKID